MGGGKALNRDAVDGLLLGFYYRSDAAMDSAIESLRTKTAQWHQDILAGSMTTAQVKDAIDFDPSFELLVDSDNADSIYSQYRAWYNTMVPSKG